MKKYFLTIGLLLTISCTLVEAGENTLNYIVKDGYNDFTHKYAIDALDLTMLDNLELKILGKKYGNEKTDSRLSRIESKIFGAIQSGNPLKRMDLISKYSNKYLIAAMSSAAGTSHGMRYGGHRGCCGRHHRIYPNNWNRHPHGTLTGFEPPINYRYSPNYNGYYANGLYHNYYGNNLGANFKTRIKRFFNPNYNPHYVYNSSNPYIYGNHRPIRHTNTIELFNGNAGGNIGGQIYDNFGGDSILNTNSSAAVTIID